MKRERWTCATITLATTTGPRRVPAETYGNWGVHEPLPYGSAISSPWSVTHVPTGFAVGYGLPKPVARKLAQRLQKIVGDTPIAAGLRGVPEPIKEAMRVAVRMAYEPSQQPAEPQPAIDATGAPAV